LLGQERIIVAATTRNVRAGVCLRSPAARFRERGAPGCAALFGTLNRMLDLNNPISAGALAPRASKCRNCRSSKGGVRVRDGLVQRSPVPHGYEQSNPPRCFSEPAPPSTRNWPTSQNLKSSRPQDAQRLPNGTLPFSSTTKTDRFFPRLRAPKHPRGCTHRTARKAIC